MFRKIFNINLDFEKSKTKIIADVVTLIILLILGFGFSLYNMLLPNNTIIQCNKNNNICTIKYTSILNNTSSIRKNISFRISDIHDINFVKAHRTSARGYIFANINISIKSQNNYNYISRIIEPSINNEDTLFLVNDLKAYISSSDNEFEFNRNNINQNTRSGYFFGIIIYCIIASLLIIIDICQYKKLN